jgi:hypothetical protein
MRERREKERGRRRNIPVKATLCKSPQQIFTTLSPLKAPSICLGTEKKYLRCPCSRVWWSPACQSVYSLALHCWPYSELPHV